MRYSYIESNQSQTTVYKTWSLST